MLTTIATYSFPCEAQIAKRWAFLVFLGLDFTLFPVKNTYLCKDCGFIEKD